MYFKRKEKRVGEKERERARRFKGEMGKKENERERERIVNQGNPLLNRGSSGGGEKKKRKTQNRGKENGSSGREIKVGSLK